MHVVALAALLVLGKHAPAGDAYALVWKPTQGQSLAYTLKLTMDVAESRIQVSADMNETVAQVEESGDYDLLTTTANTKVKVEGQEPEDGDEIPPKTVHFDARGHRVSADDDDEDSPISGVLASVTEFVAPEAPVHTGDKWLRFVESDPAKHTVGYRISYEVAGMDKVGSEDAIRIKFTFKESEGIEPVTADGSFYFSARDFALLRFDGDVENYKQDADSIPGNVRLRLLKKD